MHHHLTPYSVHSKNTQQQFAPLKKGPPSLPPFHSRRRLLAGQARPASAMQRWEARNGCRAASRAPVQSVLWSVLSRHFCKGAAAACVLLRVACLLGACLLACLLGWNGSPSCWGRMGPISVGTYLRMCVLMSVGTHACLHGWMLLGVCWLRWLPVAGR